MNSSGNNSNLSLKNIRFFNGSNLGERNNFTGDVRCGKRVRIESDLEINGRCDYVDQQTGWGLSQWTYADSSNYNKSTDSLIAKLKYIEDNYVTQLDVDNSMNNSSARGLIYYQTNTFPSLASGDTYPFPVTTLAQNTSLIIRDSNDSTMDLKIQKANLEVGNILTCLDNEGTVGWLSPGSISVQPLARTIVTQNGTVNDYSFRVIDTGTSGTSQVRGLFVYPDIYSNTYNKALLQRDFTLLGGIGTLPTAPNQRTFIGPFSYGSEGISFEGTYEKDSVVYPGKTRISGGYYSNTIDQSIDLSYEGIKINAAPNGAVVVNNNYIVKNLNSNQWTKPFVTKTVSIKDEYPVLSCLKGDITNPAINNGVIINPYLNQHNFNKFVKSGDMGIICADWGDFFSDGSSSTINEKDYRLFIGPWSAYYDGISIRPTLQSEEDLQFVPNNSGYVRITSGASDVNGSPSKYMEWNREGITIVQNGNNQFSVYGNMRVINKTSALINNTNTNIINSTFSIGSSTSFVPFNSHGNFSINGGTVNIKTDETIVNGYVLTSTDTVGTVSWKPLPTNYNLFSVTSLSVTSLTGRNIILTGQSLNNASLSIQNCNISQLINDSYLLIDNTALNAKVRFSLCDGAGTGQIPLEIHTDAIYLNKKAVLTQAVYPDNSIQISAYTGAKALAGSYTNTNMTIDSSGRITALSSNPFYLPSTINSNVTFNSNVSVNGTLSTNRFEIPNNMYLKNNSSPSVFTPYANIVFNTDYFQQDLSSPPVFTHTPNRNTNYNVKTGWMGVGTFSSNQSSYIHNINLPLRISYRWAYVSTLQDDNEEAIPWVQVTSYSVRIKNLQTNEITNLGNVTTGLPTTSYFFHKRKISSSIVCNSEKTKWGIKIPINVINIKYQSPPNMNCEIQLQINGIWRNTGEYLSIINMNFNVNYTYNASNPYEWYVENFNTDNGATSQYTQVCVNGQFAVYPPVGQSSFPYQQANSLETQNVTSSISPYDGDNIVCLGNTSISQLTVDNNLYLPNGQIFATGIAGRQGMPSFESPFPYGVIGSSNSYVSWSSFFNFYWTANGKYQIWVDYTLIFEGSPNYSDHRIKTNFNNLEPVLDRICQVPLYQFDFIECDVIPSTKDHIGFKAHELQEQFPDFPCLVSGEKDATNSDGKMLLQSVDYQEFSIVLMKAIQELKAENELLKLQMQEIYSMVRHLQPS